jgi:hypothetical protein
VGFTIGQLRRELAARGEAGFLARFAAPALVARRKPGAEPASFVTRWTSSGSSPSERDDEAQEVLFVEKRQDAPFPERIGLGRAPNVDIVVRRDGISKYHAYFVPVSSTEYQLADAGSKNGTFVDQDRLRDRAPHALRDRCVVRFGAEAFDFLMPRSLVALLRESPA